LTTAQTASLTSAQIGALTSAQVAAMETADVAALLTGQVVAFTTAQIVALTTEQVAAVSTAGIAVLTTSQFVALETVDVAALRTSQIAAITTTQASVITMDQYSAITSSQYSALTTAAVAAVSPTALTTASPIVLDLNGDGVRTIGVSDGVRFDLFADGNQVQTGWVSAGDGLLVLDRDHDGQITSGAELFGTSTKMVDGTTAADGYAALREFDQNADGVISSDDTVFADLRVWVDGNSDGLTDAGELRTLASLNVASINANAAVGTETDNGNILGLVSSYQTTDGVNHDAADVWFQVEVSSTTDAVSKDDLRSRVGGLSQAIESYVDLNAASAVPPQPTLSTANAMASSNVVAAAPIAGGMADAMKQFEVQGGLGAKVDLGVASADKKLNFPGLQDPNAAGILSSGGKG
jgi:hypothetical protein